MDRSGHRFDDLCLPETPGGGEVMSGPGAGSGVTSPANDGAPVEDRSAWSESIALSRSSDRDVNRHPG